MKHNKKRNTAFIYETLSRELTKAILEKDSTKKEQIVSIFKEYFAGSSILAQELQIYKSILDTNNIKKSIAERVLQESKVAHASLNEKNIFDAQSQLIAKVNKGLGQQVWSNFIPNFKFLASVDAIFNKKTSLKGRVLFEQAAVDTMSEKRESSGDIALKPVDALTYRTFIDKFNGKYETLLQEQKDLLNNYIASFADEGFEMRLYLNSELGRLKSALTESHESAQDELTKQNIEGVTEYLEGFRKREFGDGDLIKVLKTQELVQELSTND
tara:strand:+ start:128 stop:940 length:813 start_codon:yes stop_codon:yes gene_type:complete